MVDAFIREGELGEIAREPKMEDDDRVMSIISKKFNVILAVVMGIYSLGVKRFQSIYYERLLQVSGDPNLRASLKGYKSTDLVQNIFQFSVANGPTLTSRSDEERMYRAFYNDARAIDRMVYMNVRLQQAYHEDAKKPPRLILYLSSASSGRTENIFARAIPKRALPVIDGRPYSFHRDRSQMFALLVHRSTTNDLTESIENLGRVKESLLEVAELSKRKLFDFCSQCVLDGQTPEFCDRAEVCTAEQAMYKAIQERRTEVRNLGLTTALDNYKTLLKAKPKDESQEKLVEFFRYVFKREIRDVAAEKMLRQQQLVLMQCATSAMSSNPRTYVREEHLRAGRDFIVGTVQYLPIKPRVDAIKYQRILGLILRFYKTPPQGDEA